MKKMTITCPACGKAFPADRSQPPAFCPLCGERLPEDAVPEKRTPWLPQEDAIPDLPTEGA